jgi:hypothetical protein
MDKRDTLIAEQQLKIRDLEERTEDMTEVFSDIYMSLICIGGPLNDNLLRFDNKQQAFLHEIKNQIEPFLKREI